jgi:hypothetical protein
MAAQLGASAGKPLQSAYRTFSKEMRNRPLVNMMESI